MLRKFIEQSWLAVVSSLVFGVLVAGVYGSLEDRIALNAQHKLEREMRQLIPTAVSFDTIKNEKGLPLYYLGKDAAGHLLGYEIIADGFGFADKITLLVAFDAELKKILGMSVLGSNETPGFGDKLKEAPFQGQFNGCPAEKLTVVKGEKGSSDRNIVAITGATISSEAAVKIINDAIIKIKQAAGKP